MPAPTEPALTAAALRNRARRDQVLSAARKCFVENGFHGSSMAELAKRAGMSVGHIYHYYESKDAIIEAIVDRDIEEAPGMLDDFSGADDVVAAMMDRLDETVERHLDTGQGGPAARNPRRGRAQSQDCGKAPFGGCGRPQSADPGAIGAAVEPRSARGRRPRGGHRRHLPGADRASRPQSRSGPRRIRPHRAPRPARIAH